MRIEIRKTAKGNRDITQQQRETISHIEIEYGKKFTGRGPEEAYEFIKSVFPLYTEYGF